MTKKIALMSAVVFLVGLTLFDAYFDVKEVIEHDIQLLIQLIAMRLLPPLSLFAIVTYLYLKQRKTARLMQRVIDCSADAIGIVDNQSKFIVWNKAATLAYGYDQVEIRDVELPSLYADDASRQAMLAKLHKNGIVKAHEILMRRKDGDLRPFELSISLLKERGMVCGSICVARDVSEIKKALNNERYMRAQMQRYSGEVEALNDISGMLRLCDTESQVYHIVAAQTPRVFQAKQGALYIFNPKLSHFHLASYWGDEAPEKEIYSPTECRALRSQEVHFGRESTVCFHLNQVITDSYLCAPLVARGDVLGLLHLQFDSIKDLSEEALRIYINSRQYCAQSLAQHLASAIVNIRLREELKAQSIHDPLTGLYNRRYLDETMSKEISQAMRHKHNLGIIMVDLDHFKNINDSWGHPVGDRVLQKFADLLSTSFRKEDVVCRYGGEEFVIVLSGIGKDDLLAKAEKLRQAVKEIIFKYGDQVIENITISGGLALYPQSGETADVLLNRADEALYRAKSEGRDRIILA